MSEHSSIEWTRSGPAPKPPRDGDDAAWWREYRAKKKANGVQHDGCPGVKP